VEKMKAHICLVRGQKVLPDRVSGAAVRQREIPLAERERQAVQV
jgi:hypothetical protein